MQLEEEQQEKALQPISNIPPLPVWPVSKPGPQVTPPQPGERPMPTRTDQMIEVAYNQETGVSSARMPDNAIPNVVLPTTADSGNQQIETDRNRKGERHKKARR